MNKVPHVKKVSLLLLLCFLPILPGCWDRVEVEDLGILVGEAIDKPDHPEDREEAVEQRGGRRHRVTLTQQYIVPEVIGGGERGGGAQKSAFYNQTSEGDTLYMIARDYQSMRIDRPPFGQHIKVIVIGEDAARSFGLHRLLNLFLRDQSVRRTVKVMVATGKGRDVLNIVPPIEDLPAIHLSDLSENVDRSFRMAPVMKLKDVSQKMVEESSFLLQQVVPDHREVKISGAAVIKGKTKRLAGWLDEEEIQGINWLTGKGEEGVIEGVEERSKELIDYEIQSYKTQILPEIKGGKLRFTVNIETQGRLGEDWLVPGNAFEKLLKKAEKATEKQIKLVVDKALNKTQKQLKVDVAGFGKQLSIAYPQMWMKEKKDWDKHFSRIPIDVHVKAHVVEFGTKGTK
ncbi:Ger(x)C family spore germination protein [Salinithrix halophila]|uniref:Ger(X)C family spore germination protein n=1 Tax=Salinithrix halophila TaxID=1485204 RepID=A0ABV8JIL8_9BACL